MRHGHFAQHPIAHERCQLSRAGLIASLLELLTQGADAHELPRLRREVGQALGKHEREGQLVAGTGFGVRHLRSLAESLGLPLMPIRRWEYIAASAARKLADIRPAHPTQVVPTPLLHAASTSSSAGPVPPTQPTTRAPPGAQPVHVHRRRWAKPTTLESALCLIEGLKTKLHRAQAAVRYWKKKHAASQAETGAVKRQLALRSFTTAPKRRRTANSRDSLSVLGGIPWPSAGTSGTLGRSLCSCSLTQSAPGRRSTGGSNCWLATSSSNHNNGMTGTVLMCN